jgi:tripartite-type tricarboxylate transporter receptor subunit TctC
MRDIRLSRRTFTGRATMAAAGIVRTTTVFGESSLPHSPITLAIPFAAGGVTDVVSRLAAAKASGAHRSTHSYWPRGQSQCHRRNARGSSDGSILLMVTVAIHTIHPRMARKKPYDLLIDFSPTSLIAAVPHVPCRGEDETKKWYPAPDK